LLNGPIKNLALVAYYFPPIGGAGVQRAVYLSRYLSEFGWNVRIITAQPFDYPATDDSLIDSIPPGVAVHRVGVIEQRQSTEPDRELTSEFLSGIGGRVKEYLRLPDGKIYSMLSFAKELKRLHAESSFDTVLTTSPPPSIHLAGLFGRKSLGIKWIADFRDVWYPGGFDIYPTRVHVELSKRMKDHLIRHADTIVVVTEGHHSQLIANYPDRDDNIKLIPNGFEESLFDSEAGADKSGERKIGYVGTLNDLTYVPEFFEMLVGICSEAGSVVDIRGIVTDEIRSHLKSLDPEGGLIRIGEYIPHAEAIRFRSESSINLVTLAPAASLGATIPGKMYEVLRTRRPVIAVAGRDTDCWRLAERFEDVVLVDAANVPASRDAVLNLIRDSGGPIPIRPGIEEYSWHSLAVKYDTVLREVLWK